MWSVELQCLWNMVVNKSLKLCGQLGEFPAFGLRSLSLDSGNNEFHLIVE
jgi:hypothetical protein